MSDPAGGPAVTPVDDERRRVYFALWPDGSTRARIVEGLDRWLAGHDGRAQRADQWHVTLVFVGGIEAQKLPELEQAAASVRGSPTVLELDRVEHWRKPRVACLTASHVPSALATLVQELQRALRDRGIAFDEKPFRPHLTLARKVSRLRSIDPWPVLAWPAREFVLVESQSDADGSRYTPIARFELGG